MTIILPIIKGTICVLLALLAGKQQHLSASLRHALIMLAIVSLPLLVLLGEPSADRAITFTAPEPFTDIWQQLETRPTPAEAEAATTFDLSWLPWALYGLISAGLCLIHITRLTRAQRWVAALPLLEHRNGVDIRQRDEAGTPFAWGVRRNTIIVPPDWDAWSAERQRMVLAHEQAHLRRGDVATSAASFFICALFWWHPLIWVARRQALALAEQACDDAVLRDGADPADYAEQLLALSSRTSPRSAALCGMAASPSRLGIRIHAALNEKTRRTPMSTTSTFALATAFAALMLGLGAVDVSAEQTDLSDQAITELMDIKASLDRGDRQIAVERIDRRLAAPGTGDHLRAQLLNLKGYAHYQANEFDKAITSYESLVSLASSAPEGLRRSAVYTLALLKYSQGRFTDTVQHLNQWIELASTPGPAPLMLMANAQLQIGDQAEALRFTEAAFEAARQKGYDVQPGWQQLHDYLSTGGERPALLSREYLPLKKVAPVYPEDAKANGVEGFVVVEFDVAEDGTTRSARVVQAEPPGTFDAAALEAAAQFRYRPREMDGEPVVVSGVRNRISFALPPSG